MLHQTNYMRGINTLRKGIQIKYRVIIKIKQKYDYNIGGIVRADRVIGAIQVTLSLCTKG